MEGREGKRRGRGCALGFWNHRRRDLAEGLIPRALPKIPSSLSSAQIIGTIHAANTKGLATRVAKRMAKFSHATTSLPLLSPLPFPRDLFVSLHSLSILNRAEDTRRILPSTCFSIPNGESISSRNPVPELHPWSRMKQKRDEEEDRERHEREHADESADAMGEGDKERKRERENARSRPVARASISKHGDVSR